MRFIELPDVIGNVVWGEGDSGQDDPGSSGLEGAEDLVEIGAGVFDAEAAEAVVAAELYDDDGGLHGDDAVDALKAVLGGIAADSFIYDAIQIAFGVKVGLEIVGVALAGVGAVAGGEAVGGC